MYKEYNYNYYSQCGKDVKEYVLLKRKGFLGRTDFTILVLGTIYPM